MSMDYERIRPWENVIANVAREYNRKFNMVDVEDIRQELYGWFLTHPNKLNEWEAIGKQDAKNLIYRSLRNHALDYCQYWKAKGGGYEVEDLFYYTPEMIENLLPQILLGESSSGPQLNLTKTSKPSVVAESGNIETMKAEISLGMSKLSDEDQMILTSRFELNLEFAEIQELLDLNTEVAARARVKRSVKRLINKIGGYKPQLDEDSPSPEEDAGDRPSSLLE